MEICRSQRVSKKLGHFERKFQTEGCHCWCQKTTVIALSCGIKISAVHCYSGLMSIDACDQPVCLCVCLSVCLSASIYLEPLDRSSRNFVCRSPVVVAQSSIGSVALRHVLPVLWMTSRLAVMGATPKRRGCTVQRLP